MSDRFKPAFETTHGYAMSPQATFPSLEEFGDWYEQSFIAPCVVVEKGEDFRTALARWYNAGTEDGKLAVAVIVWARLQRDHEKVLAARCQEYEKGIAGRREDVEDWKKLHAIESDDAQSGRNAISNLTSENEKLRLGAATLQQQLETARKEFGHDYDAACKKLDDQNAEINRLRKELDEARTVFVPFPKSRRSKKLRAFGKSKKLRQ